MPKSHPLVRAFIETDDVSFVCLHALPEPHCPAVRAMNAFRDGTPLNDAIELAQSVPQKETDPNLYILFLCAWISYSARQQRLIECQAVVDRARALLSEHVPAEIRAAVSIAEMGLAHIQGNIVLHEKLFRDALDTMAPDAPRRRVYLCGYFYYMALDGRLDEVEHEISAFLTQRWLTKRRQSNYSQQWIHLVRFTNSVTTGQTEAAQRYRDKLGQDPQVLVGQVLREVQNGERVLAMMRGHAPGEPRTLSAVTDHTALFNRLGLPITSFPAWLISAGYLAAGNATEALLWARRCTQSDLMEGGANFAGYALIRAELASGNVEAARRLLDIRRQEGRVHYLDNLFWTRVALLESNIDAATMAYTQLLKDAERYEAHGRVAFEFNLANELLPGHLVRLQRGLSPSPTTTADPQAPAKPPAPSRGVARLVGDSSALATIRKTIAQFAALDVPVLVTGETGTGKELVARALHEASPRHQEPFIAINCAAIAESILESELFGHTKGAFSGAVKARQGFFEEAGDGTVFLDEIGDISPRLQTSLLRVLESGDIRPVGSSRSKKVSCRVVAATNAALEQKVEAGGFRADLYYRLYRLHIHIPSLRDRPNDIIPLAYYFLNDGSMASGKTLSTDLQKALQAERWPGNVRQLANTIERMRLLNSDKQAYGIEDLDADLLQSRASNGSQSAADAAIWELGDMPNFGSHQTLPAPQSTAPTPTTQGGDVSGFLRRGRTRLRRLQRLRELFQQHKTLTRSEIVQLLGVSSVTATNDLKLLLGEDFIVRIEPSASPRSHYFELKNG